MQGSGDHLDSGIERVQFDEAAPALSSAVVGSRQSAVGSRQTSKSSVEPSAVGSGITVLGAMPVGQQSDAEEIRGLTLQPEPARVARAVAEPEIIPPEPAPLPVSGGGWTLMFLCAGLALVACCILIPQVDQNRRLMWDQEKLRLDLEQIKKQVSTNEEFVKMVADSPALAERLAVRQMKLIRKDSSILALKGQPSADEMSPLALVSVPPPPELPAYEPVGGKLATLCRDAHSRLYLVGLGLMLIAFGMVLGYTPRRVG